ELPLFGHRAELDFLRKGADSAVAGSGTGFEITGAAGIGKSRLVDEVIATDERLRWISVVCERYHRTTPYFAAGRLLRGLLGLPENTPPAVVGRTLRAAVRNHAPTQKPWLPLIGAVLDLELPTSKQSRALDPKFVKDRTRDAAGELIAALLTEPTGVVVNNAELMDESSAGVFTQLAGRVGSLPILLASIRRPEETGWAGADLETIEIGPLDDQDALDLVNTLREDDPLIAHVADQVVERGDGNPMFLIELALAVGGDGELPETVEATVSARIDRLAPDHRKLLRYAGTIGRAFSPELLGAALGDEVPEVFDPGACSALEAFLEPEHGTDRLRFRQKMYRHVAYAGLPFKTRRMLHERIGRELESRAGARADESAELLSMHFDEAGDSSRAWHYSVVAGDDAAGKNANAEAVTFYARALKWTGRRPGLARDSIRRVAEALGDTAEPAGLHDQADEAYARAFGLAASRADRIRLLRKRGLLRERAGRYPQALTWFTRGSRLSPDARSPAVLTEQAELEIARAGVRFRQSRYADAVSCAEAAVPLAERADARATLAHALYLLSVTKRYRSGHDDGEAKQALKLYRAEKDLIGVSNVLNTQGIAAWRAGEWDTALKRYEGSSEARIQAGDLVRAAYITNNTALVLSDQGKWAEAEALFRQARNQFRAAGDRWMIGVSTSNLGRALTRSGNFEDGEHYLEEARDLLIEIGADQFVLDAESRLVESLLFQGRSRLVLRKLKELAPRVEMSQGTFELRSMLARLAGYAHLQLGHGAKARGQLDDALAIAREGDDSYQIGLTLEAIERNDAGAQDERTAIFAQLGIVRTPAIP
ncbi:MAG: tetratricopeptide repeat protein, partial [Acidimicrobiia bacterium]|nr:tetratricopeptide repeat protein [Acidimicrobiia bacterium]